MVVHNPEQSRFEIVEEGETSELAYRLQPGKIVFVHAGVPVKLRKRGLAGELVATGLSYAREHGLKVVPLCPYVVSYIQRHPEHRDLVDEYYLNRVS
ncbi:MAG: GNAT family N-acetyltransferase [Acidobacteriota bacterium]